MEAGLDKPVLNWDVLSAVAQFLDGDDLTSYMLTCRALYRAGLHIRLQNITFSTDPYDYARDPDDTVIDVLSACNFVLKEEYRASHIQYININLINAIELDIPISAYQSICQVLQRANNLLGITISEYETMLEQYPPLGIAVSSLTTLTDLHIRGAGLRSHRSLMRMNSPVASIHLDLDYPHGEGEVSLIRPPSLLKHFGRSLRYVALDIPEGAAMRFPRGLTLEAVQELRVIVGGLPMTEFMDVCPNVVKVTWFDYHEYRDVRHEAEELRFDTQNTRWGRLDSLSATIKSCFIPDFNVSAREWSGLTWRPSIREQFDQLMSIIKPSALQLVIEAYSFEPNGLRDLNLKPCVQKLDITLSLDYSPSALSFVVRIDSLLPSRF